MKIKNNFPFIALSISSDNEVLWVKGNLQKNFIVIGTVYKPPKMKITEHLKNCLEFVKQKFPKSGRII